MSLLNRDPTKTTFNRFTAVYHSACMDQGFPTMIKLADVASADAGFIENDTLQLMVKIDLPSPYRSLWGKKRDWDSRKETGHVGLVNQGATCYMSALLQNMYHNSKLRRAVYQMPIVDVAKRAGSIPWQMQRLFYELQTAARAPETRGMTRSFGWTEQQAFQQHDIQEYAHSRTTGRPLRA